MRAGDETYWPNSACSTSKSGRTQWSSVSVLWVTLTFDLQGQTTGNALEMKLTSRITLFTSKSAQTQWASVAVHSSTLTCDLQGQTTGNALEAKLTGRIVLFQRQNKRKHSEKVSQYFR